MRRRATAGDRRRSVVYLDPAPRAAFDAREEPHARLDQRDESFVPHVLAIVAGTTVDFPNNDRTYHNVFSLSKTRSFDLGRYAAGHSKAIRFDRPGIVRVFCDIHSHMSAFILVFAHRYFARDRRRGPLPHRQRAAGYVHRRGLERGHGAATRAARRFLTAAAKSSSRSSSSSDEDPLVADQPHLSWQRGARGPDHCASRSTASTSRSPRRRRTSCGAGSRRPARCSRRTAPRCSATSRARPASSRTCRISRRRSTRRIPLTVEPIAAEYQRQIGSDLLVVTDPTGRVLAQAGRLRMPDVPAAHDAVVGCDQRARGRLLVAASRGIIQVVSVPSLIVNKENNEIEVVGTLSVGFSLDEQSAQQFKALTNSEMAFVVGGTVQASTLPKEAFGTLASLAGIRRRPSRGDWRLRLRRGQPDAGLTPTGEGATVATQGLPDRDHPAVAHRPAALPERGSPRTLLSRRSSPCSPRRSSATASPARSRGRSAAITATMREMAATGDLTRRIRAAARARAGRTRTRGCSRRRSTR